jgi:hypothetical protein
VHVIKKNKLQRHCLCRLVSHYYVVIEAGLFVLRLFLSIEKVREGSPSEEKVRMFIERLSDENSLCKINKYFGSYEYHRNIAKSGFLIRICWRSLGTFLAIVVK